VLISSFSDHFPKFLSNISLLQDEDFVASENGSIDSDGEASDSDESSEEGSDADEEDDDDDDPASPAHQKDIPAELQDTLRQALEGEKVLDEPILSDSEISREFPEEEDDVLGALGAGSDFDSDDETSGATGSEGSAQEIRRAASTIAAAQSAAAVAAATRGPEGRAAAAAIAAAVSPTATTTTRRRTRFGEEALSEQALAGSQRMNLSPIHTRPTSPPMEVFGAMLPSLEHNNHNNDNDGATSRPIAQRTRAHVSLMDVTIEELEDQLGPATGLNEPLLYFGVDDAAEWERFISGLQTSLDYGVDNNTGAVGTGSLLGGDVVGTVGDDGLLNNTLGGGTGAGIAGTGTAAGGTNPLDAEFDDSDDEDFVVELERMLQESEAMRLHHGFDPDLGISLPNDFFNYNGSGGGSGKQYGKSLLRNSGGPRTRSGRRSYKKQRIEKPPRRSARHLRNTVAERPLYMASLMDRRAGKTTAAALEPGIVEAHPALQQAYGPTLGAQGSLPNGLDELATLAAALATGPPIPLPSDMEKPGAAAVAKTVLWRAPLPKAMRKYDLSVQPDESAPIVGAHFQAAQYSDLYLSIHYHVQLLAQTTAMAVASNDTESAAAGAKLLREMEEFVSNQTNSRKASGIPAYVSACLGIDTGEGLGEGEELRPFEAGGAGAGGSGRGGRNGASGSEGQENVALGRRWTPQNPGNIYTVADVSVLRAAPRMLQLLPSLAVDTATAAAGGEGGTESSPELENRQPARTSATQEGRKRRRRGKVATEHFIWDKLPADVSLALNPVRRFFDPAMEPSPPQFYSTAQLRFTPAEDHLLAWGIRKHLYNWAKISEELLPTKTEKALFHRKKNLSSSAYPDGIIKEVVSLITGELTLAEQVLLVQALNFYGKQVKKWEIICKLHLPHRHPQVLAMLWSDRQKQITGRKDGVVTDVATVRAAAAAAPRANQGLVAQNNNDCDVGAGGDGNDGGAADQMAMAEIMAQQQQYVANQQMDAAAIGAGLLPPPNNMDPAAAAAAAAAAAMPSFQPAGWMGDLPQPAPMFTLPQQQQQQQVLSGALAPPRLVEWDQQPGAEQADPRRRQQQRQQQPREAPPRNPASQLHDMLTRLGPGTESAPSAPAEAVWSAEEDKPVLRAALANGGKLGEKQLEELSNTIHRNKEEIIARSEVLVERAREKMRQERERRQGAVAAAAGGG
jgi:hypothetical protein